MEDEIKLSEYKALRHCRKFRDTHWLLGISFCLPHDCFRRLWTLYKMKFQTQQSESRNGKILQFQIQCWWDSLSRSYPRSSKGCGDVGTERPSPRELLIINPHYEWSEVPIQKVVWLETDPPNWYIRLISDRFLTEGVTAAWSCAFLGYASPCRCSDF